MATTTAVATTTSSPIHSAAAGPLPRHGIRGRHHRRHSSTRCCRRPRRGRTGPPRQGQHHRRCMEPRNRFGAIRRPCPRSPQRWKRWAVTPLQPEASLEALTMFRTGSSPPCTTAPPVVVVVVVRTRRRRGCHDRLRKRHLARQQEPR
jgi:hypothetical protein